MKVIMLAIIVIALVVGIGFFNAQATPSGNVEIRGKVILEGETDYSGIEVRFIYFHDIRRTQITKTDEDGKYLFKSIIPGEHEVVARRKGYEEYHQKFDIPDHPAMIIFDDIFLQKTVMNKIYLPLIVKE